MARADQVGSMLQEAFPGLRVTSTVRTKAQQDALVASGATKARNSQHPHGDGLDIVLPANVKPAQVRTFLKSKGYNPGEFLNESGKGSGQGTGAHLHIGLAPKPAKGGDPASSGGGSLLEMARQGLSRPAPDLSRATKGVVDGGTVIANNQNKVVAHTLSPALVQAYNSHELDDNPEARDLIDAAVKDGSVLVPRGQKLARPTPRTAGNRFGMGVRNILEGTGRLVDIAAAPLNAGINALTGSELSTTPFRDVGAAASDAMNLSKPESDSEKLIGSLIEGGTQGLITAGASLPFAGAEGATGAVARALSASPILDTVSGATSGASSETARQAGAGPVGQFVAGLAGGMVPVGAAGAIERAASRVPRNVAEVVADTPRAAMIDETGNLTPHGQEIAARHGATPEDINAAYEAPPNVQRGVANDPAIPESVAREATNDAPVAPQEPVVRAVDTPATAEPKLVDAAPAQAPEALPTTALDRVAAAQSEGIDMTRGQATKSFDVQDAESRLRNSNGAEGEQMRQFAANQAEQVKSAVNRFKASIDDTVATPAERGAALQDAMRDLRDLGKAGVSELYKQAKASAELLGDNARNLINLDHEPILSKMREIWSDESVPDNVRNGLRQMAAEYGLIGEKPITIEGETSVKLRQPGTENTRTITFTGAPKNLDVITAERFRQRINDMWEAGKRNHQEAIKPILDDAVEQAVERAVTNEHGNVGQAFKDARAAHKAQKETFAAKDVVQDIIDWKTGTRTGKLDPVTALNRALANDTNLKRVKAVLLSKPTVQSKAAWQAIKAHGVAQIFEKATTQNTNIGGEITDAVSGAKLRTAIKDFTPSKLAILLDKDEFGQLMKLSRIIEDVTVPISGTTNPSGSGNLIMRLIGNVENKVTAAWAAAGTVIGGPVGTAIGGGVGRVVGEATKSARAAKETAETLKGATEYTPAQAAIEARAAPKVSIASKVASKAKSAGASTIRNFIEIYGSPRILAPVLASAGGADE